MNKSNFAYIFLFGFITQSALSQLIISEYSASNMNQFEDNYGKFEDWIEIYNTSDTAIDISSFGLSDKESKPQKWTFPVGTIIDSDEYFIVWCSGRDIVAGGNFHSNFKLTQSKGNEYLVLSDANGNVLESSNYSLTLLGHSQIKNDLENWEISTNPTPGKANDIVDAFIAYTDTPIISLEAGFYNDKVEISISQENTDNLIRYTINGSEPNISSTAYTSPITFNSTTVLRAKVFSNDPKILPGKIAFASYLINEDYSLPVFSIVADGIQELANGNGELRPIGSIEYFVDKTLSSSSYGELNRHGQDSWINPQRSIDWVSRDEMGYSKALNEKLFSYSDRDEYQRFMLRASGDDNYPAFQDENHEGSAHIRDEYVHTLAAQGEMKLDIRAVERTIVFLNGVYWGIYSPRERPVDHDYTDYYYNQGKYDLQYILTWGETWTEYGGKQAFDDWRVFRDFILNNDMSDSGNYQKVKDQMQVLGLIDYMLINLNTVCSDWINYNTGWWRGVNPDGKHKKWGYILWDNDATFDYYINYSGVPNTNPDATPCDIEEISNFVDDFWEGSGGFELDSTQAQFCTTIQNGTSPYPANDTIFLEVINDDFECCINDWDDNCEAQYQIYLSGQQDTLIAEDCMTILNGTSPYSASDSIFQIVIAIDEFCCETEWDQTCQDIYNNTANVSDEQRLNENFGMHEKIFLKLQEENPEFRQLYYSRQADMMNTTFSCINMLNTLDSMAAVIEPEMPRHISRWGGSLAEWSSNLEQMRDFIAQRCELLDEGMLDCYDVTGPYELTLMVEPQGAGDIDLNTIEVKSFPWTGQYFGGMDNLIDADPGADYDFVRWESKSGNILFPDLVSENARIVLTQNDTLIAHFKPETLDIHEADANKFNLNVYPSPTNGVVNISYNISRSSDVKVEIHDAVGRSVYKFPENKNTTDNSYNLNFDTKANGLIDGTYIVRLRTDYGNTHKKLIIAN